MATQPVTRPPGFRCVAWYLIAQFAVSTVGLTAASAATVRIPGGTPVIVKLDQVVSTESNNAGDTVRASVAADVTISGNVVIPAGATAQAEVSHVKKPGAVGAPGEISVSVTAVQAASGEMIRVLPQAVSGEGESKQTSSLVVTLVCCVLGLLMKGGHATIQAGTTLNTYTAQEVNMEL